jgi:hypothetical protein
MIRVVKKEGMKKGLKITLIVIGVIVALVILLILFVRFYASNIQDEQEGWTLIKTQENPYKIFFPEKYSLDSGDILLYGEGYLERRANSLINLNPQNNDSVFRILENQRALYKPEEKDPSFKVWFEKLNDTDYIRYVEFIRQDMGGVRQEANMSFTTLNYKSHEYYIYLRTDMNVTKKYNSIGGVYVLFPEHNTVYFIFLFNTYYNHCFPNGGPDCKIYEDEKILGQYEINSIVKQLIDSVSSSN